MFDSDNEDADAFTETAPLESHNIRPSYANIYHPCPTNQRPSSNSSGNQSYKPPISSPWNSNKPVVLPAPDEDPFAAYPNSIILNGFVITNEISKARHRDYSFMVFCQEDGMIYGIPRALTTPPRAGKLTEIQRWRRKRDLEFGIQLEFVAGRNYDVKEFAKGSSNSLLVENIDGKNCFEVQCVLQPDLKKFYCFEFGESEQPRPLDYYLENLAYDCLITFDEDEAIQKRLYFTIYKINKASADQSIISSTPWIKDLPTTILSDNDIEELKSSSNYKANITGLRYADDRVLHLREENKVEIVFCANFNDLPPIGSIFQFDYFFHPLKKLAVVAEVLQIDDELEKRVIENGKEGIDRDYMFEKCLNISEEKNGFYHDKTLGMICDSMGCLRYTPYSERKPKEIYVRLQACLRQPALFNIIEICEDSYDAIQACEPPFIQADGVIVDAKTGRIFSSKYPSLDLRVDDAKKFKIGEFISGTFYLNNNEDFYDNRYYSSDASRMNTEPLKTLQVTDDYALVVMKIRRIKYTAPISKKQMKKNPQSEDIQAFREYNFFLQGYFEGAHGGLIGGSKGRVAATDGDYAYAILETCLPGGQYIFNYVSQYDTLRYPLDLEKNAMLRKHVSEVLGNSEPFIDDERSCHSPVSTASISSHASSFPLHLHENVDSDSRLPPTSSSRTSSTYESYENENIQDDPQSVTPLLYQTPPLPPRSTASSRVASSASSQRFESPTLTYYSPSTTPIPFTAASTHPYSSAAASIHSQNGIANHRSQNLSSSIPNQRIHSPTNSDISERMNNVQLVQTCRKPFPQSGVPRYRNMCLYERSEHISPRLALILDQMDSYLTNPAPPITTSIKKKSSDENKMPEFEKFVAKFLN